jgi:hypothetical protein
MKRLKRKSENSMRKLVLLLIGLVALNGCATNTITPEERQILAEVSGSNNPVEPFRVSVKSEPPGASVYVIGDDGQAGTFIGKTTVELSFLPKQNKSYNKTLFVETKDAKTAFSQGKARVFFECLVVKEGYHPVILSEVVLWRSDFEKAGRDIAIEALSGGHKTYTVTLRAAADRGPGATNQLPKR